MIAVGIFISMLLAGLEKGKFEEEYWRMQEKGIVGTSPFPSIYGNEKRGSIIVLFAADTEGKIVDARAGWGVGITTIRLFHTMEEYIGLTLEEAKEFSERDTDQPAFPSSEKQKCVFAAIEEIEKKMREMVEEKSSEGESF